MTLLNDVNCDSLYNKIFVILFNENAHTKTIYIKNNYRIKFTYTARREIGENGECSPRGRGPEPEPVGSPRGHRSAARQRVVGYLHAICVSYRQVILESKSSAFNGAIINIFEQLVYVQVSARKAGSTEMIWREYSTVTLYKYHLQIIIVL